MLHIVPVLFAYIKNSTHILAYVIHNTHILCICYILFPYSLHMVVVGSVILYVLVIGILLWAAFATIDCMHTALAPSHSGLHSVVGGERPHCLRCCVALHQLAQFCCQLFEALKHGLLMLLVRNNVR